MWINAKEAGIATRARTQLDKKKKKTVRQFKNQYHYLFMSTIASSSKSEDKK